MRVLSDPHRGNQDIWAQKVTGVVAYQPGQQGKEWQLLKVRTAEPKWPPGFKDYTKLKKDKVMVLVKFLTI